MNKILILSTLGMYYEGITSVIYNYSSELYCKNIEFHFVAYEDVDENLKNKFEKIGVVHVLPDRKENFVRYVQSLYRVLMNGFDVVHIHGNSGTMCIETVLAKLNQVKKIIIQNHSVTCNHPWLNVVMKKIAFATSDKKLAVSKESGDWLYGKIPYTIINNAIDLNKYFFDESNRKGIRSKYGLTKEIVIGNVARFTSEKNHLFLIETFSKLVVVFPDIKLLLLGDGPQLEEIKKLVQDRKIDKNIIFTGRVSNPEIYYSAMDLFMFPSRYESLGLVLIEAQANGLKCIASTNIPRVSNCSRTVEYLSTDNEVLWIETAKKCINQYDSSFRISQALMNKKHIVEGGFDIETEAEKLRTIYEE